MLTRDKRWEIFHGDISLEEFATEKMPKAIFKDVVNNHVKNAFEVVHKLLTHSYYEYLFLDIAITRALQIFEMALVLRYQELNDGAVWDLKNKPLIQLIKWFRERHYFEINDEGFLTHVRESRNALSHLKGHNFGGIAGIHWIDTVCDLINGLYDDVMLRKQRWETTNEFQSKLDTFLSEGARFQYLDMTYYIYSMGPLRVDNRVDPISCHFSLLPIFDPTSTNLKVPIVLSYPYNKLSLDTYLVDFTWGARKVFLSNELNDSERKQIEEFRNKVNSNEEYIAHHSMLLFDADNRIRDLVRESVNSK